MQSKRRYDTLPLRSLPPEQTSANYGQREQTASSEGKESSLNAGDLGSVSGWEESLEEEMATLLYSCLKTILGTVDQSVNKHKKVPALVVFTLWLHHFLIVENIH